mgnify:CR=1 FL=1
MPGHVRRRAAMICTLALAMVCVHRAKEQAALLFCAAVGVSQSETHLLLKKNHKMVELFHKRLDKARADYVMEVQKNMTFGGSMQWSDVEVDEANFGKARVPVPRGHRRNLSLMWENWLGLVERGNPESLVLKRLPTAYTVARAPGPGPIKSTDWASIAEEYVVGRNIILHSDSARAYKKPMPGVIHDAVVHQKKKVILNGKGAWMQPHYTKRITHKLPNGQTVQVLAGTQIIDRAWRFIRKHLNGRHGVPGTESTANRIRSAQWCYWHKETDRWEATGKMLTKLRDLDSARENMA